MKNRKKPDTVCYPLCAETAFCLMEVVAALTILVFLIISVLAVYDRCMAAAADSTLKMHAFEVARENMENLLAMDSVELKVENGQSEIYPDITWQTTVEDFYDPATSKTWLQATCTADYVDTSNTEQTIELKHWLTDLSDEDLKAFDQNEPNKFKTNEPNGVKTIEPNVPG